MTGPPHKVPHANILHGAEDEPPPLLGSWRRIYIVVLCYLALIIAGFYVFTRVFAS